MPSSPEKRSHQKPARLLTFVSGAASSWLGIVAYNLVHTIDRAPGAVKHVSGWALVGAAVIGGTVGTYLAVLLHELGHTLVAWCLRVPLKSLTVGWGWRLLDVHLAGARVILRAVPNGGMSCFNSPDEMTVRGRRLLVLGGPTMNLLLALLCIPWMLTFSPMGFVAAGFCSLNLVTSFQNLVSRSGGSDGAALRGLKKHRGSTTIREVNKQHAVRAFLTQDSGDLVRKLEAHLTEHHSPDATDRAAQACILRLAYGYGRQGRYEEAAAIYQDLRARELCDAADAATLGACWADAVLSDAVLTGHSVTVEDLARCAEAILAAPDSSGVRHTRSLLALVAGDAAQAAELAESCLPDDELLPDDLVTVRATIALARAAFGDTDGARAHLMHVPESSPWHAAAMAGLAASAYQGEA